MAFLVWPVLRARRVRLGLLAQPVSLVPLVPLV
jgi:hypothetical protein